MTSPRAFSLTDAEQRRIERVDRLVLLGASSVAELLANLSDTSWTVRRAVVAGLAALGDDAVEPLCSWLTDQRSSERAIAAAVDALSASVGTTATRAVQVLLGDPRPEIAADAAQILGRRAAEEAGPALTALLDHADDNVAVAAIEALGAIGGSQALEALIDVLGRKNFFRTFPALQVLSRANDPRVVAPLAHLLDDDTYRIEAARALGRSGSPHAIRPLASLLPRAGARAGDAIVRLVALALADLIARAEWHGATERVTEVLGDVVGAHAGRMVAALRTADAAERTSIAVVLGRIGDASVVPELARLLDDPDVRPAATDAIQRITRREDDSLIAALTSDDPATRAAVLPVVRTARAIEAVRALLDDAEPEIRALACEALARAGDAGAVPRLFAALGDPSPRVGHAATAAIQSLGVADTAALAITALETGAPAVRRYALRIIAYMGFSNAFGAVRAAIDDGDVRVAELAVAALAMMQDPRVEPALAQLAGDPREPIRAAVMRTAGHRGSGESLRILERGLADEAAWVRYYACQGLGRIGEGASTSLVVRRLSDATPHVRIAAIEALGRLATPAAWQALCSAIRSDDLDEQRAALASMAMRGQDEALGYLLEGARSLDGATRLIALAGLGRRREPAALAALVAAAGGPEPAECEAALSLLGERSDLPATTALVDLALAMEISHPVHLAVSRPSPGRVHAIALGLATADERAAPSLIAALARMGDDPAKAALFGALGSANPWLRRAAASALIGIGADGARAAVAQLARTDPDPEVRRVCAAASADPS